jgi:hypothetical protein
VFKGQADARPFEAFQCCLRAGRLNALGAAFAVTAAACGGCDGAAAVTAGLVSGFEAQLQLAFAGIDAGVMVSLIIFILCLRCGLK